MGPSSPEPSNETTWVVKLSAGGKPVPPPDHVLLGSYDGAAVFTAESAAALKSPVLWQAAVRELLIKLATESDQGGMPEAKVSKVRSGQVGSGQ